MDPFFTSKNIRLYLGDVLETLRQLPDGCIDLIFADPPYNLSNNGFTCHAGRRVSVNKGTWDKSNGWRKYFGFHLDWICN